MKTNDKHFIGLAVIWLVYIALGVTYMLATPPLESSDEYKHYPVVHYIQTANKLPFLNPDGSDLWLQEGAQPPLYYAFAAALTFWVDTSDLEQVHIVNPYAFVGNPNQIRNKNLIIHDADLDKFPGQGSVLAVYLIRLASIGLGLGTIFVVFKLGELVESTQTRLVAAAITAFNPMFLFVSAAVNNDSLAILLGHSGLYLLVRYWHASRQERPQYQRAAWLGLVLGLGILTKLSLGGLLGLAGLVVAGLMWRNKRIRPYAIEGIIILVVTFLISGWWFIRNWQLYGDLTGLSAFIAVQGTRDVPLNLAGWMDEFGTFYRSFWGLFGGVNVAAPALFYYLANLLTALGLAGFVRWVWVYKKLFWQMGIWLLAAWTGVMIVLLVRWNIISPAFQGRLIFPALGAINILLAMGWRQLVGVRRQTAVSFIIPAFFLLAALVIPWTTIRPAYAFPQPLTNVPAEFTFGPVTFGQGAGKIRLVGMEMDANQTVHPAQEPVKLILYWQAETPIEKDYLSAVHLLGRGLDSVGSVNRYPAWGMIPTSQWQPGQVWRDEYQVYVNKTAGAPSQLRLSVSIYDAEQKKALPAYWPDGTRSDLLLVGTPIRLIPISPPPQPSNSLDIVFAKGITLAGYDIEPGPFLPETEVEFTLYWQATDAPSKDYTVFVQLLNAGQTQVAGADGPPVRNDYPTSLWQTDDWIDDERLISLPPDLPPGSYSIHIGLYDPISGQRLQRLDGNGDFVKIQLTVAANQ